MPTTRDATFARVLKASVGETSEGELSEFVTDDVLVWSPNLAVRSRAELEAAVAGRDQALSHVEVNLRGVYPTTSGLVAEWKLSADHTGDLELDEDVLPATGAHLELAGCTVAEFRGDRIRAMRHYFDDIAILEQVVFSPPDVRQSRTVA